MRHPGKTAPLVISGWTLVVWMLLAMGSGIGYLASMVVAAITGRRIAKSLGAVDTEPREVAVVAAHGLWSAALQLASAICRHYWPIALIAALLSRRCRQVVLVAAVIDGVVDWVEAQRQRRRRHQAGRAGQPTSCSSGSTTSPTASACGPEWCASGTRRPQAADPDLKPHLAQPMC